MVKTEPEFLKVMLAALDCHITIILPLPLYPQKSSHYLYLQKLGHYLYPLITKLYLPMPVAPVALYSIFFICWLYTYIKHEY
jgi:hypothetical protein